MSFGKGSTKIGADLGINYELDADTSQADAELSQLENRKNSTMGRVNRAIRTGYNSLIVFSSLLGNEIAQQYQSMAQGAFTAAETFSLIATAQTSTVILAFNAAAGFGSAVMLMAQGFELLAKAEEQRTRNSNVLSVNNLWRNY